MGRERNEGMRGERAGRRNGERKWDFRGSRRKGARIGIERVGSWGQGRKVGGVECQVRDRREGRGS